MHAFADSGERDIYDLLDTHDIIPMVYFITDPFTLLKVCTINICFLNLFLSWSRVDLPG